MIPTYHYIKHAYEHEIKKPSTFMKTIFFSLVKKNVLI